MPDVHTDSRTCYPLRSPAQISAAFLTSSAQSAVRVHHLHCSFTPPRAVRACRCSLCSRRVVRRRGTPDIPFPFLALRPRATGASIILIVSGRRGGAPPHSRSYRSSRPAAFAEAPHQHTPSCVSFVPRPRNPSDEITPSCSLAWLNPRTPSLRCSRQSRSASRGAEHSLV